MKSDIVPHHARLLPSTRRIVVTYDCRDDPERSMLQDRLGRHTVNSIGFLAQVDKIPAGSAERESRCEAETGHSDRASAKALEATLRRRLENPRNRLGTFRAARSIRA